MVLQRLLWLQGKTIAVASIQGRQVGRDTDIPDTMGKSKEELKRLTLQNCFRVKVTLESLLALPQGGQGACNTQQACLAELAAKTNATGIGLSLPEMKLPAWLQEVPLQPQFVHMVQGKE